MTTRWKGDKKNGSSSSSSSSSSSDVNGSMIRHYMTSNVENKVCVECGERGPATYVDMSIGSYICTKCSGILRGINPPHRVKSISMSSFTKEEVAFLGSRGNAWVNAVWNNGKQNYLQQDDTETLKAAIREKYESKRFYVDPQTIKQIPSSSSNQISHPPKISSSSSSSLIGSTILNKKMTTTTSPTSTTTTNKSNTVTSRPLVPTLNSSNLNATSSPLTAVSAITSSPFESFANFDNVKFETPPSDPLRAHRSNGESTPFTATSLQPSLQQATPTPLNTNTTPLSSAPKEDRYAALKDLDEIFKSSVCIAPSASDNGGSGGSTGADLFGGISSPVSNGGASIFGNNGSATTSGSIFSNPSNISPSMGSSGDNNVGWACFNEPPPINNSSSSTVNPFTGSTNLTQLNTSPWPTTGSSPVQPIQNTPWPQQSPSNNLINNTNFQSDTNDLFANAPKPNLVIESIQKEIFSTASSNGNINNIMSNGNGNPWGTPGTTSSDNNNTFIKLSNNPTNPFLN